MGAPAWRSALYIVNKLLLKAFSKSKKVSKTFTLHNLPIETLQGEIKEQLQSDVIHEFDVGYLQGYTQISVRTAHDLYKMRDDISKGPFGVMA